MKTTAQTKAQTYVVPVVRIKSVNVECAGIGIGSGNTTPEDCDSNDFSFNEESYPISKTSVWDN